MVRKLFLNDKFILLLILLNTVFIFLGGYTVSQHDRFLISIADNSITALFIIELLIKLKANGITHYFASNWNKLDFFLILVSVPALITFAFNLDMLDVSFLLVFRVLRVFKAFRFLKFIPNVNHSRRNSESIKNINFHSNWLCYLCFSNRYFVVSFV
ncbi:MAG: ion transporter [Bacteroidales bacterium]|nr:ion transporter [Bacteroidales bacterium]